MGKKIGTGSLGALALVSLLLAALLPLGCDPSGPPGSVRPAAAADSEWRWLQQAKKDLDGKRQRLASLTASTRAPLTPEARQLAKEVEDETRELNRRLLEFINSDPPRAGEPLTERQKAAIRMKSDEDILVAREHIEQGGDYERAIDIYEEALAVDPENPRLKGELQKARARRYITAEVFAKVKEGMSEDQVRALLGQPNLHNVKEYPDRGVVAWFYPKDAVGAAAGVWFEKKETGLVVYEADFEAIEPRRGPAEPLAPRAPRPRPTAPAPRT
jgi:tetratricopeptide (TPR) repeat protein